MSKPTLASAYSPAAIAKRWSKSRGYIYAKITSGKLKAINLAEEGDRPCYVVLEEDLHDFEQLARERVLNAIEARERMKGQGS